MATLWKYFNKPKLSSALSIYLFIKRSAKLSPFQGIVKTMYVRIKAQAKLLKLV